MYELPGRTSAQACGSSGRLAPARCALSLRGGGRRRLLGNVRLALHRAGLLGLAHARLQHRQRALGPLRGLALGAGRARRGVAGRARQRETGSACGLGRALLAFLRRPARLLFAGPRWRLRCSRCSGQQRVAKPPMCMASV